MQYLAMTKQILPALKITFPVAPDYGLKVQELYGVKGVPSLFLVGLDGRIEHAWQGEAEFLTDDIECVLDRLAAGGRDR